VSRGPLPNPNRRRRNQPTIPTTDLPAEGRKGRIPACPYKLQKAGKAWWKWAWHTPQAEAWDPGAHYVVARRAQLEDDIDALDSVAGLFDDVVGADDEQQAARNLEAAIKRLKGMASGRSTVHREMRELDDRLGLTPKGLAALRWKVTDASEQPDAKPATVTRLRAVDPQAAAKG
jgi:hypothetical protein